MLAALARLPVHASADPILAAAARDGALAYFTKRLVQVQYAAFQAAGYPIGSGSTESANKVVVEARLKGSGMHWARVHVDPLVALAYGDLRQPLGRDLAADRCSPADRR